MTPLHLSSASHSLLSPSIPTRRVAQAVVWILCGLSLLGGLTGSVAHAQENDPNACDVEGEVPDVVVGDIQELSRHGSLNGITAFSVGTTSCNIGTCWLKWIDDTPEHPVIGQNAFRLKDGRFEQIGQSWLKHGFFAVSDNLCFDDCLATDGNHLGVHCSDPYSSFFNGWQQQLGPKSEVNPTTGVFPYPFGSQGVSGDAIYKRLQIKDEDIDPALNPGADYFVEGQYVTQDDAAAGRDHNNNGYRQVLIVGGGSFIDMVLTAGLPTVEGPAIDAWSAADPEVQSARVDSPDDGTYVAASKVTALGKGRYQYEYAIQNLTSHRAARRLTIPLPFGAVVTDAGFHDVDYHSGELYSGDDWTVEIDNGAGAHSITWSTATVDENPLANALRWGTLYNYRFIADAPPTPGVLELELFDPGGTTLTIPLQAPALCDNDGTCEPGEDCGGCPADCSLPGGTCCGDGQCAGTEDACSCQEDCGLPPSSESVCEDGVDGDCDGLTDCEDPDCCGAATCDDGIDGDQDSYATCDCDDGDATVWNPPGEVPVLMLDQEGVNGTRLLWTPPEEFGGLSVSYDAIRALAPGDLVTDTVCVISNASTETALDVDPGPTPGEVFFYLVHAENDCPRGSGSWGRSSSEEGRIARSCP